MRVGSVILLALILGAVFFAGSSWWWSMPVPVFVAGLLISRRARCEHLYPALIPPASNSDGRPCLPAGSVAIAVSLVGGRPEETASVN
jgi:hypothetical protein